MSQPHDLPRLPSPAAAAGYWIDAWQRSILTLDVLRQRGNTYLAQDAKDAPNVLGFPFELIRDGRTLPRGAEVMGHGLGSFSVERRHLRAMPAARV